MHMAVLDVLVCRETEILADKFCAVLSQLKQQDASSGLTGMETQYQLLSEITPNPDDVVKSSAESNSHKNRSKYFLPRKEYRGVLRGTVIIIS